MAQQRVKPLGSLCDILDSRRKPVTKRDRVSGECPYYGATGIVDYVEDYIFDEPLVLVGEDGAKWGAGENTAFSVDGRCWVNNHAHVIRPHRDIVLDKWIIYYLNASDLSPFITGLTVPKMNQEKLQEIPIPLPPLLEQKHIVAILDEAFEGIDTAVANSEKNLANARELFDNCLNSVFARNGKGWVETTLEHVLAEQPRNGWSPPAENHADSGIPVLTLSSVTGFQFRASKIKFTSAKADAGRHYWVRNGDFLITRSNTPELVGHVAIADGIARPTIYPDLIMRMIPAPDRMLTQFLYYQMRTLSLRREITGRAQGANPTMKKISKGAVQSLPITMPPVSQQQEIVAQLGILSVATQRLEAIYQRKLASLAELKQAILRKAFAGELTAQPEKALPEAAE